MYERQKERDHKEDLVVGRRIIIKWIFEEKNLRGTDWIHLAQYRD
jgi:hypothetical protein